MKKITRQHAIEMFRQLGVMVLGYLDETTLSATLDNLEKCRKVHEDYQKLSEELAKRLYEGKDEEGKKAFFELVKKFEKEQDMDKKVEIEGMMKAHTEFYELYVKQIKVLTQLYFKEIDLDLTEVDENAFIKGIILGKKDVRVHDIVAFFAPMFKEAETAEAAEAEEAEAEKQDFSELDDMLAE